MAPGRLDPLLRPVYRLLAATFLVVGLLFFLFPDGTIDTLNAVGALFGFPRAPHLAHRFWLGLGVAYMAVVTVLAQQISAAPAERRLLMPPLAVGKAVSSGTCLLFFAFEHAYFVYLANFLVDASIALGVLWTWRLTDPTRAAVGGGAEAGALGARSRAILGAVCEAFLPAGGAFPEGATDVALADKLEAHFAGVGPFGLPAAALLLRWIEAQPLLFGLRARRFSTLPLDERVRVLEAMEGSRALARRHPVLMLKVPLGLHAYADAALARRVGHDRSHLELKLRVAAERRAAGGKGPYPLPEPPPGRQSV